MAVSIIKETIEIPDFTTDLSGSAYIVRKINLKDGMMHRLLQVDMFEDAYLPSAGAEQDRPSVEIVVTPYPAQPTNMRFKTTPPTFFNRYPAAGDDTVLFKAIGEVQPDQPTKFTQFPSEQIAAMNKTWFYSDHLYINLHFMGAPEIEFGSIALSFMFVVDDKNVSQMTHSLGILAESHDAMCANLMSTGHMTNLQKLKGNTFPQWRFGGIRPERMLSTVAISSGFFLTLATRDEERMNVLGNIRQALRRSSSMQPFDAAFGGSNLSGSIEYPDWLRVGLTASLKTGPLREQWPPTKHADNGNVLMF